MLFRFFTLATLIGLAQACGLIQHLFSSDTIDGNRYGIHSLSISMTSVFDDL
jgi:hypothetical protein